MSIKRIQKWLSSNENHFKINPIFSYKPSFSPAVSKTVQECNQIDLVYMRSMSITKDSIEYNYILSLLDLLSRFMELTSLFSKDSNEVLRHLKGIFRLLFITLWIDNGSFVLMILLTITSKAAYQYSSIVLCVR